MTKSTIFLAAVLALLAASACSGASDVEVQSDSGNTGVGTRKDGVSDTGKDGHTAAGNGDPFVGSWSCTSLSTTTFTTPPDKPSAMSIVQAVVVATDDGDGDITAVRIPDDGGPPCTLHSKLNSDDVSSTLEAGQSCTSPSGGTVTYTAGIAAMNGATSYTTSSAYRYSGTNAKAEEVIGTGSATSTCTRM
jgi:hypothetical protein